MTTTAEERAKELRAFIGGELRYKGQWRTLDGTLDTVEALITQALHQAQNDKLEEAAVLSLKVATRQAELENEARAGKKIFERARYEHAAIQFGAFAKKIRSLKSKDTP